MNRFRRSRPLSISALVIGLAAVLTGCGGGGGGGGGGGSTPAATPILVRVQGPEGVISAAPGGGFEPVIPRKFVQVVLTAPWPTSMEVSLDGVQLEEVRSDNIARQDELQAQGKGFWNPLDIDVQKTPPEWRLAVVFPPSQKCSLGNVSIRNRGTDGSVSSPLNLAFSPWRVSATAPTFDSVSLSWTRRSRFAQPVIVERSDNGGPFAQVGQLDPSEITFSDLRTVTDRTAYSYRLRATAPNPQEECISAVTNITTPLGPMTGVTDITLTRPSGSGTFVYTTPLPRFVPRWDALIVSVTNVAVDSTGAGLDLGAVRHTDTRGASGSMNPAGPTCPQAITLSPGATAPTSAFGPTLRVAGNWSAEVVCTSNVFPRNSIDLRVAWRAPP
jgi:hypothetical protein